MTFKRRYAFFIMVYLKTPNDIHKTDPPAGSCCHGADRHRDDSHPLLHESHRCADTVLDVCIAGAKFCKPIRMQRYPCGSGCTAGVFFVQVLSEKGKSWYTVLKRI